MFYSPKGGCKRDDDWAAVTAGALTASVEVRGGAAPQIAAVPPVLHFTASGSQQIQIQNQGYAPLEIDAITLSRSDPAGAVRLIRYSVEDRGACPPVTLPSAAVLLNRTTDLDVEATSERVKARNGEGHCLVAGDGTIDEADIAAVAVTPSIDQIASTWTVGTRAVWSDALFTRDGRGWRLAARKQTAVVGKALYPFRLMGDPLSFHVAAQKVHRWRVETPLIEKALAP